MVRFANHASIFFRFLTQYPLNSLIELIKRSISPGNQIEMVIFGLHQNSRIRSDFELTGQMEFIFGFLKRLLRFKTMYKSIPGNSKPPGHFLIRLRFGQRSEERRVGNGVTSDIA